MNGRVLKFVSPSGRFELTLGCDVTAQILEFCRKAGAHETGGILVGYYAGAQSDAVVTGISGPPRDSIAGRSSFVRGVKGLQAWLNQLWKSKQQYYLGEWHYHPHASSQASGVDVEQLKTFSASPPLRCPEPVMLIIGGDPQGDWNVSAYVFPRGQATETMILSEAYEED